MVCNKVKGKDMMHQDVLSGVLQRAIHRAGGAFTMEPHSGALLWSPTMEPHLYGLQSEVTIGPSRNKLPCLGGRRDILLALDSTLAVVGFAVTQPPA
jgi:hypothetical protein